MRLLALLLLCAGPAAPFAVGAEPVPPFKHRFLGADYSTGKMAIISEGGKVEWEYPNRHDVHDAQVLPGGNILTHTSATTVVEITPAKEIAWKYEAKPAPGKAGRVEVHAFERLPSGVTMVAESGNGRLVEVNQAGEIVHVVPLKLAKIDAHRDTRRVRSLPSGNYLVCHESIGQVREYTRQGEVVWQYELDLAGRPASGGHGVEGHGVNVYNALRLPNGNTLIGGGNNNRVLEVTPDKKVVWELGQDDIPGVKLAWVASLHVLPNGNLVVGNCHGVEGGPAGNPQIIEVTRDKKLVGAYRDTKTFGNNLVTVVLLDGASK